jgi:SAM-dependent methyltransferase
VSIDIYVPPADERYFDVLEYPGFPLPVADQAFDLVYSSHMLYYELDNPRFFSELRRVLKPDGMAIHVMPTCAWRLATCAAYYFYLAKRVPVHFLRMANRHGSAAVAPDRSPANDSSAPRSWWHWIVCMPLDPTSTISKELWAWRRKAVTRVLAGEGFQSISVSSLRLCYTQWALFGKSLSLGVRRVLAYVLGSASVVYVTKRNAG